MLKIELVCDHCSAHSFVVVEDDGPEVNYCPHCGVALVSEQEGEDDE